METSDQLTVPTREDVEREMQERIPDLLRRVTRHGPLYSTYSNYQSVDPSHRAPPNGTDAYSGEPFYTNYEVWRGTLDYIMIGILPSAAGQALVNVRVDELVKIPEWKRLEPGLPNQTWPSDHVPIGAVCTITFNNILPI